MSKKFLSLAAAGALLVTATAAANAQSSTSEKTPGAQMQEKGSVKGSPGASGYAPGQLMQEKGSVKGTTGASGFAPGHTSGSATVKGGADVDVGKGGAKAGAKTDIDAGAKVK